MWLLPRYVLGKWNLVNLHLIITRLIRRILIIHLLDFYFCNLLLVFLCLILKSSQFILLTLIWRLHQIINLFLHINIMLCDLLLLVSVRLDLFCLMVYIDSEYICKRFFSWLTVNLKALALDFRFCERNLLPLFWLWILWELRILVTMARRYFFN